MKAEQLLNGRHTFISLNFMFIFCPINNLPQKRGIRSGQHGIFRHNQQVIIGRFLFTNLFNPTKEKNNVHFSTRATKNLVRQYIFLFPFIKFIINKNILCKGFILTIFHLSQIFHLCSFMSALIQRGLLIKHYVLAIKYFSPHIDMEIL